MDNIIYTTPEDQIKKLKSQNLTIEDEGSAKAALRTYGYSNLIKSYREPYIITSENEKSYRSGVTFKQIYSLYILDKNLRNGVMAAMLDLEEHIKELTSDVVAKSFGVHQEEYLVYRNYRNKSKRKKRFTLSGILDTMQKTLNTDKDPIHHYKIEHDIVPPWILFKSIYFGTIINFVDQLKIKEQNELVHNLYSIDKLKVTEDKARMLMMDTLFVAQEYRNVAAHGGRIYNYECASNVRKGEIFTPDFKKDFTGFGQLLLLLSFLDYKGPFDHLRFILDQQVNRHCHSFPQDVTYLGQILNIDIIQKKFVYVSNSSNKYHLNPHCSGIKDVHRMDFEEAEKKGYIPCRRCVKG